MSERGQKIFKWVVWIIIGILVAIRIFQMAHLV